MTSASPSEERASSCARKAVAAGVTWATAAAFAFTAFAGGSAAAVPSASAGRLPKSAGPAVSPPPDRTLCYLHSSIYLSIYLAIYLAIYLSVYNP